MNKIINQTTEWSNLRQLLQQEAECLHHNAMSSHPGRLLSAAGLTVDLSKHAVSPALHQHFKHWLELRQFSSQRQQYFQGGRINVTEDRPALHTALRQPQAQLANLFSSDIVEDIRAARRSMSEIVESVCSGARLGLSQQPVRHVINIGIGGSDLGPVMAVEALQPYIDSNISFHFIANVDHSYTQRLLSTLDPGRTLVVMVSKSFRTSETLDNARLVRAWLAEHYDDPASVFYGVTANTPAAVDFGLPSSQILPMWDWVGGRFSLWSAVGLSIALAVGTSHFEEMLSGAFAMDQHFLQASWEDNIPVQMALLGAWYASFCQAATQAVIVYSDYLRSFPDYLQQLHMESLGKRVTKAGHPVDYPTGQILWGGVGTSSQHSFHQLLMCGTHFVPVDFVLPINDDQGQKNTALIANCLAQSEVLLCGTSDAALQQKLSHMNIDSATQASLLQHQRIPGGTPSTLITMDQLTPSTLGALISLYEHKVFVQGLLWDINPFDQWGVECGKQLATGLQHYLLNDASEVEMHATTRRMIDLYFKT